MALSVKAYLHQSSWKDEPTEIRRFSVDQDVSTSYAYLTQKIGQAFPGLKPDDVMLAWTGGFVCMCLRMRVCD